MTITTKEFIQAQLNKAQTTSDYSLTVGTAFYEEICELALQALTPPADIEELVKLMGEATPGPYYAVNSQSGPPIDKTIRASADEAHPPMLYVYFERDHEYVAAALNALPALLSEIGRLRQDAARYRHLRDDQGKATYSDWLGIYRADDRCAYDGAGCDQVVDAQMLKCAAQLNKDTQR